jgi:hypothetical protein
MKLNLILRRIYAQPAWLILIFAILQLLIALLVDGFILSFDESVWHYIGRSWFRYGLTPYTGGIDNKSPFIFAIYGLSDRLFGVNYWFPRVLGTACQCLSLWYLYKVARHLAGKEAGLWALQIYGFILMWNISNGKYPSYTETYEVTCVIISFYVFLTAKQRYRLFLGGALAALGVAFRLTGVISVFALGLASLRRRLTDVLVFALGFLVGIAVLAGIMMLCGIRLSDFIFYGFLDNLVAGSLTDHPMHEKVKRFTEMFWFSELVLLYPGVVAYLLMGKKLDWPVLWAIFTFAGICGIGQYDPGHLKDMLPSLALMNGIAIGRVVEQYKLPVRKVALVLWVVFIPKLPEPLSSFRAVFRPPNITSEKFCQEPKPNNFARKKLAAWIRSTTSPDEKIFFAGYEAQIQVYSERLSPTIFFQGDAMDTKIEKAGLMKELPSNEPPLIVIPRFPEYGQNVDQDVRDFISALVSKDYNFDRCMYGYDIFRHK